MSFPIVLNLGVGRSGTTYLHNALKLAYAGRAHVLHEDLHGRCAWIRRYFRCYQAERIAAALAEPDISRWVERVRSMAEQMPVLITGSTTSHLAPVLWAQCGSQLRTLHVHRHPLNVAAASFVGAWATNWNRIADASVDPSLWVLTPFDAGTRFTAVGARWEALGAFARIAYNWLERTAAAVEFNAMHADRVMHLTLDARRDVFQDPGFIRRLTPLIEREPVRHALNQVQGRNAGWKRALEERPLAEAWRELFELPELLAFAEDLGHDCSETAMVEAARRYQLPPGPGSWVRHHGHYWQTRRSLAKQMRRRAWLPAARAMPGGGAPRSTLSALLEGMRFWRTLIGKRAHANANADADAGDRGAKHD